VILCVHGEERPACRECCSRRAFLKGATVFTATMLALPWLDRLPVPTAVAGDRFVGFVDLSEGVTVTGANTFVGDYVVDNTGTWWVCTVSGSPGRWARISAA
jgi:hypothetical protein